MGQLYRIFSSLSLKHTKSSQSLDVHGLPVECHGPSGLVRTELHFWWLSHQSVGSSPGRDTCLLEQYTLLYLISHHQG